jgi:hypothetical protein
MQVVVSEDVEGDAIDGVQLGRRRCAELLDTEFDSLPPKIPFFSRTKCNWQFHFVFVII